MKRVWLNLRRSPSKRSEAFAAGFRRLGYAVHTGLMPYPEPGDVMLTWNRVGAGDTVARRFEQHGLPVLVVENATWGNDFCGQHWLTIARNRHNTAGMFPIGGPERWDALGVDLAPWRPDGGEIVGLPQRGIGAPPTAMPSGWVPPGCTRIRAHPGMRQAIDLEHDLRKASKVVTWGSGAAVKALLWGIKVESHMPAWIAEQQNTDESRLSMVRHLAWAQWTLDEITNGEAIEWLLNQQSMN